jgi:RimJ/RimL family protein N-acetyltransferase
MRSGRRGASGSLRSMSERLLVRAPTVDDLLAYEAHFLHPEIMRRLRPPPLPTFDETQVLDLLHRDCRHWDSHGFGPWVLEDPRNGGFVGRGGLAWTEVEDVLAVELPWSIEPDRHSEGLGTAAATLAIDQADSLGFEAVIALILPHNLASRRVAEKAGLTAEREVEHAGLPHLLYRRTLGLS